MDYRVIFICMVTVYGQVPEHYTHQKSNEATTLNSTPRDEFNKSPEIIKDSLKLESEDQFLNQPQFYLKKSLSGENNLNKIGFSQPLQFNSFSHNEGSNFNIYKTTTEALESDSSWDQNSKATDRENVDENVYLKRPKPVVYKQPKRPVKARGASTYGKSSHPQKGYRSHLYKTNVPGVFDQPQDVEMILPRDKVIFLPMVNGKPKPYDGYRAAPEEEIYHSFDKIVQKEPKDQRERRLSQGEIIYGKPKIALSPSFHRHIKRSPGQYYGGIYPYYDYSDSKSYKSNSPGYGALGRKTSATVKRKKIAYPKKHYPPISGDPYNPYKYSKKNKQRGEDKEDSQEMQSKEVSKEEEAESEEVSEEKENDSGEESSDDQQPLYKYSYDNTFHIPQLNVKFYPYEKKVKDSRVEGSKRKESYKEDDNDDEFTQGYERYVKSLPSDLESYFGKPDSSDRYSVEETQNLENNKNCKKVEPVLKEKDESSQENSEQTQNEEKRQNEICYICADEKTGDTYEQCAYQTQPVSKKYFYEGSKSYKTNDTSEPSTYRYKRSPFSYKSDELQPSESDLEEVKKNKDIFEYDYNSKPKKKSKKKYKKKKKENNLDFFGKKTGKNVNERRKRGGYDSLFGIQGASSIQRKRGTSLDLLPKSYNGPKYTYNGPVSTYEGPAEPYEGPKETYEGPINQEYYDTTDERIGDDEEESQNQEYHSSLPANYYDDENENAKNQKRQSFSPYYEYHPHEQQKYESDEYHEDSFKPSKYTGDYRFGPEHFVEEEQEEVTKNEKLKGPPSASEKKGPHKFPPQETNSAASTSTSSKENKEEILGESKVFKNGDKCQKKRKDRMICMECKNEKTGATYEQCQYSTKPKEKYYAFGTQKSYSAKKPTAPKKIEAFSSDLFPETSDVIEKKLLIKTHNKVFGSDPISTESLVPAESNNSPQVQPTHPVEDYSDQAENPAEEQKQNDTSTTTDFVESVQRIEPRDGIEGLEEYLYGAEDSEKKASEEEKQSFKSYDDYFHDLFPDFSKSSEPVPESDEKEESESERHLNFDPFANIRQFHEENSRYNEKHSKEEESEKDAEASRPDEIRLKDKKSRIPLDFFTPYSEDHKKDLEAALGEFQKKDWSNCKKIVKKKLTCYQCVDKNGVNNEECMYVEASQPISKHLSYHERKDLLPPRLEGTNETSETKSEVPRTEKEKNLKRFRKAKNSQTEIIEAEQPTDVEYLANHTKKGDFEGVKSLEIKDANKSSETKYSEPMVLKLQPGKREGKQKRKRHKTTETETKTTKTIEKNEFPLKKFSKSHPSKLENPETESFGMKLPTVSAVTEKIISQN